MVDTTARPPKGRGCGDRKEGEPYICCGTSPFGKPIESFIIDPAREWLTGWQRGVKILPRGKMPIKDMVVFVGKEFYPSAWDYVEETRRFGASRKVPKNLPFHELTPVVSRMIFVHARAIPDFGYQLDRPVPLEGCKVWRWEDEDVWAVQEVTPGWHPLFETGNITDENTNDKDRWPTPCTFGLRDLALFQHWDDHEPDHYNEFIIRFPSFSYGGKYPSSPNFATSDFDPEKETAWKIGVFMALPITHVEFCKKADTEVQQKVLEAGFEQVVLDW